MPTNLVEPAVTGFGLIRSLVCARATSCWPPPPSWSFSVGGVYLPLIVGVYTAVVSGFGGAAG